VCRRGLVFRLIDCVVTDSVEYGTDCCAKTTVNGASQLNSSRHFLASDSPDTVELTLWTMAKGDSFVLSSVETAQIHFARFTVQCAPTHPDPATGLSVEPPVILLFTKFRSRSA